MQKRQMFIQSVFIVLITSLAARAEQRMSIEDCVVYALKNSPVLQKKQIDQDNQILNTTIERAVFDFNLIAESAYTKVDAFVPYRNLNDHSITLAKSYPWGVELSSTVDIADSSDSAQMRGSWSVRVSKQILGGGTMTESLSEIDKSVFRELIRANDVSRQQRELIFQVKRAFYGIIRSLQTLKIQQILLERSRRNLAIAAEREEPLDIATAQLQVPENKSSVLKAEREIQSALDRLKVIIGIKADEELKIDDAVAFALEDFNVKEDVKYALKNHEDVLNSELEMKIRDLDTTVTRTRSLPEVSVFAEHQQVSDRGADLAGDNDQRVGLEVFWAIGQRADRARYQQALNDGRDQKLNIFQVRQTRKQQIRDIGRILVEVRQSIKLQEQQIKSGERQVQLYEDRYEGGEIGILEKIRSENDLEQSKVDLVNLKTSYMERLAEYKFNVGK